MMCLQQHYLAAIKSSQWDWEFSVFTLQRLAASSTSICWVILRHSKKGWLTTLPGKFRSLEATELNYYPSSSLIFAFPDFHIIRTFNGCNFITCLRACLPVGLDGLLWNRCQNHRLFLYYVFFFLLQWIIFTYKKKYIYIYMKF